MLTSPAAPPPAIVTAVERPSAEVGRSLLERVQDPQLPIQIPNARVDIVGEMPLRAKLALVTRLLGARQAVRSRARRYPPTILELITMVEPRPERPRGRAFDSIQALTIRYHPEPGQVVVEYCIDNCGFDRKTGALHRRRKMVSYRASGALVEQRLDRKLADLQRFFDRRRPRQPGQGTRL